jgi:chemotaxis protein histidine kinase CheA
VCVKKVVECKKLKESVEIVWEVPPLGIKSKIASKRISEMNAQMKSTLEMVKILSEKYGFDYQEAVGHLEEVSKLLKEEEDKKKLKFKLPFCNEEIAGFCCAIRPNGGLYTQCMNVPHGTEKYCKTCLKNAVNGEPQHGDISDRINNPDWVSEKGKKPLRYSKIMKNIKIDDQPVSQVEVEKEAARFGLTIPETEFEVEKSRKGRPPKATSPKKDEPAKKRGRPKKEKPIANNTNEESGEDLIAKLVAEAKLENDKESSEEETQEETQEEEASTKEALESPLDKSMDKVPNSITSTPESHTQKQQKKHKPRKTKEEKDAEKIKAKAAKAAEKEAAKAAKAAEKEAAKAAKAAEKEAAKAAKAAEKEAAKAAKAAEKEADKAAKKADKVEKIEEKNSPEGMVDELGQEKYEVSPASEHKGSDNESDEEETEVVCFEYEGKKYLRDGEKTVYDSETHHALGTWDGSKIELYDE